MFSLAVANNSRLAPRLHLLVSIDQKVVKILNANGSEQRIFHVGKSVERHRQRVAAKISICRTCRLHCENVRL
jgi:hypothetical protein